MPDQHTHCSNLYSGHLRVIEGWHTQAVILSVLIKGVGIEGTTVYRGVFISRGWN